MDFANTKMLTPHSFLETEIHLRPSSRTNYPALPKNSGARAFQDLLRIQASQPYPLIFRSKAAIYCWASASSIPVPNSNVLPSGCPTTILFKTS